MMYVSIDSETRLIEAGRLDPDLVCITVCDQESFEPELYDHFEAEEVIRGLLEHPDVVFITANGAYDFAVFMRRYPALTKLIFAAYRAGRILDIQLAQRLIDIANGELDGTYNHLGLYVKHFYSLAALHERWGLGSLAKTDTFRLRFGELIELRKKDYPEEAKKYALDDAVAPLKVWLHQKESFPHFLKDLEAQSRASFALHLMACKGIYTDAQACVEYLQEVKAEIDEHKRLLEAHGILRANGSRNTKTAKALMVAACARAGIEPSITDTGIKAKLSVEDAVAQGYVSMDAEACRDVNDPVMTAYSSFVSAKATLARVEKLQQGSGSVPLQTRFTSLVNNGRSASSEPSAPLVGANLQNLPRGGKARQVFRPEIGRVYCSVDFTGAELYTFAQVEKWATGSSLIGDALNRGLDLHCHLGAAYLGCDYDEMFANKKVGKYARARQLAKLANFGLQGGMGPERFMDSVNKVAKRPDERITIDEAARLKYLWLDTWQTQKYFDHINAMFAGSGLITVEHYISGRVRGKVNFKEAANGLFSNLSADAFKHALWSLTEECYVDESSVLFGRCVPKLPVHDEIISEIADDAQMAEAAWRKVKVMCDAYSEYTPDFPVKAEPALMRVWFKAADPAFDANGVFRPWNPVSDDKDFKPEKYLKRALALCAA
jgi:hypothetical protein